MKGQAALIAVILMLVLMLSLVFAAAGVALKDARVAEESKKARLAYFAAEAGLDDAVYRSKRGKNLPSSFSMTLNDASANISVTNIGNLREIKSSASRASAERAAYASLSNVSDIEFHYGVQVGDGGLEMSQNSEVRGAEGVGNVYSNGPVEGAGGAKITGDLTIAGANFADDVEVLGTPRANTIEDSKICGSAYYQSIDSGSLSFLNNPSNPTCQDPLTPGTANSGSSNPAPQEMPISDSKILNWKNDATLGGAITGHCGDNGVSGCNIP